MHITSAPSETSSTPWYMEGAPVFVSTGEQVGMVDVLPLQGGQLVIVQGSLFTHVRYLPLQFVRRQDASGVSLTLSKAPVEEERWKTPPVVSPI